MIKKLNTIILITLTSLALISCQNENKKEEIKYKATLPMPSSSQEIRNTKLNMVSLWYDAKKDPKAATKIGYAYSQELKDYEKALEWFKYSDSMKSLPETSNYACYSLQQVKKYKEAISWCKKAIELGSVEALIGLGFSYSNLANYKEALHWYLKAFEKKHSDSMINLGSTYTKIKDYKNAEKYYKLAIQNNDYQAYQGIAKLYHDNLQDNIKASAYAIAVINTKYTKTSVLKLLQKTWKIPKETIKKGYELQLNSSEFPIKFKGDLNLK